MKELYEKLKTLSYKERMQFLDNESKRIQQITKELQEELAVLPALDSGSDE